MSGCGAATEAPDGTVYTCADNPGHEGRHRTSDGVEWSSQCSARRHGDPLSRFRCKLQDGHAGHHRSGKVEWL